MVPNAAGAIPNTTIEATTAATSVRRMLCDSPPLGGHRERPIDTNPTRDEVRGDGHIWRSSSAWAKYADALHNTTASFWRIMAGISVIGATLAEDFATLGFGASNDYASVMLGLQLIFSD
jgi:hypothetical protein